MGRLQAPVPCEVVEALLPGIFALQGQLQHQSTSRRAPRHLSIIAASAWCRRRSCWLRLWCDCCPSGCSGMAAGGYALLQLPQVQAILASPTWPSF
jgi:hypothetical protein